MCRELKFRHWSKEAGMSNPFTFDDFDFIAGLPLHDDQSVIMQFTGLRDKNGVEIFEGDIVRIDGGGGYKVVFHSGCFVVRGMGTLSTINIMHQVEAIGNIYENPELLGSDK